MVGRQEQVSRSSGCSVTWGKCTTGSEGKLSRVESKSSNSVFENCSKMARRAKKEALFVNPLCLVHADWSDCKISFADLCLAIPGCSWLGVSSTFLDDLISCVCLPISISPKAFLMAIPSTCCLNSLVGAVRKRSYHAFVEASCSESGVGGSSSEDCP